MPQQAPIFNTKLLGNHTQGISAEIGDAGKRGRREGDSDIKAFPSVRPVWDAEDLPPMELHGAEQNGFDGSFRFTSLRAISRPRNRHSDMRLELQAVSCCMATGALMFHGSHTALHWSLAQIDDRLQVEHSVFISDSFHHFEQESTGLAAIVPTQDAYNEGKCAHVVTKTAYLFSASSFAAGYWYVHASHACVGALLHDFTHVCTRQASM